MKNNNVKVTYAVPEEVNSDGHEVLFCNRVQFVGEGRVTLYGMNEDGTRYTMAEKITTINLINIQAK